ncbi:hypothetical protein ACB371_16770 [Klebsiella pneumoniae]
MRLAGPQVLSNTRQADQIHIDAGGVEQNQGKAAEKKACHGILAM